MPIYLSVSERKLINETELKRAEDGCLKAFLEEKEIK